MRKTLLMFLVVLMNTLNAQVDLLPKIHSNVYKENAHFDDYGFTYTTRNLMPYLGLPQLFKSTFGANSLQTGLPVFKGIVEPIDTLGQVFSISQSFQHYDDNSYSMWSAGERHRGYQLYDSTLRVVTNLYALNIFPDIHGITKLNDGRIAYFENQLDSVNFYHPPAIQDSSMHLALGHDLVVLNIEDTSKTTLFRWFNRIPTTMIIPEYLHEGDQRPDLIDWGHPNWVEEDHDGNLLVSWRHLGVCKIDIESGDVIWWTGLPAGLASKNGFQELTCIAGDCRMRLQHNFKPVKGQVGQYMLFDNGDRQRDSSRALFLNIDETTSEVEVTKEYWFEYSEFMGSVDKLEDGCILVNVPTLGRLSIDTIDSWAKRNVLTDSIGPYLASAGSHLYFISDEASIISHYWTDSLNYIYIADLVNYKDWPSLYWNGNKLKLTKLVNHAKWTIDYNKSQNASKKVFGLAFDFGIATGYAYIPDPGGKELKEAKIKKRIKYLRSRLNDQKPPAMPRTDD